MAASWTGRRHGVSSTKIQLMLGALLMAASLQDDWLHATKKKSTGRVSAQTTTKAKLVIDDKEYEADCSQKRVQLEECGTNGCTEVAEYCAIRRIPYAVAERFRRGRPLTAAERQQRPWKNEVGPGCAQRDPFTGEFAGAEDCLFVDLYCPSDYLTKKPVDSAGANRRLVVVFEGLEMRSSLAHSLYPGYGVSKFQYMLAVVHYRTGVLGFLSLESELAPPNLALFDQQLALQFLSGGVSMQGVGADGKFSVLPPSGTLQVSLMAFGSGATMASMHLLNPTSRKLINTVLLSGGSALAPEAIVTRPWRNAQRLAGDLNCPNINSNQSIADCLRDVNRTSAKQLVEAAAQAFPLVRFAAFVDGAINGGAPVLQQNCQKNQTQTCEVPVFLNGKSVADLIESLERDQVSSDKQQNDNDSPPMPANLIVGYPAQAALNHYLNTKDLNLTAFVEREVQGLSGVNLTEMLSPSASHPVIDRLEKIFAPFEPFRASRRALANTMFQQYFAGEPNLDSAAAIDQKWLSVVDAMNDYLVGGPMQAVLLSAWRANIASRAKDANALQTQLASYVFKPEAGFEFKNGNSAEGGATVTIMPFLDQLADTRGDKVTQEMKNALGQFAASSLSDMLLFFRCSKVDVFNSMNQDGPQTITTNLRALVKNAAPDIMRCMAGDCLDIAGDQKKLEVTNANNQLDFSNQMAIGTGFGDTSAVGSKAYRVQKNQMWSSVAPLSASLAATLDTEQQLRRQDQNNASKAASAGATMWGLIGGLILLGVLCIVLTLLTVKLAMATRKPNEPVETSVHFDPSTGTVQQHQQQPTAT